MQDPTDDVQSFVGTHWAGQILSPITLAPSAMFQASLEFGRRFPLLAELLSTSRLTALKTSQGSRHLHAWTAPSGEVFGWLCFPPHRISPNIDLHPDHQLLLTCFGGIDEYWNDPPSLLNNLECALASQSFAPGFGGREALFQECSVDSNGTIRPEEFRTFAIEANGDFFVYHRDSGKVLLIGFDTGRSSVKHVETYENLVYTIDGAPDFRSWVELLASEFLDKACKV